MRSHCWLPFASPLLRTGIAGFAVVSVIAFSGNAKAASATFDYIGSGQSYTLQSDFNPDWNAVPDGFVGSGPGTTIQIFYSATATSTNATTPTNFTSPTASGAGLGLTGVTGPVSLTFTYLGFEAEYTNQAEASFTYDSTSPMFQNHTGGSVTATVNGAVASGSATSPGLVPFLFNSTNYTTPAGTAVNGGPIGSDVAIGFLIDPNNPTIAYAFLEDIWQGGDADFDDMVVEIQINPTNIGITGTTPVPAALPLFAGGLGTIGFFGWRRKRKASPVTA